MPTEESRLWDQYCAAIDQLRHTPTAENELKAKEAFQAWERVFMGEKVPA